MNIVIQILGLAFGLTYITWIFYLAVMSLSRAKQAGTLSKTALVFGTPILILGYFLDFLLNVFVMTPILLELPREWNVTTRLKRHHRESTGWRLSIVKWFEQMLDPYDPSGDHV